MRGDRPEKIQVEGDIPNLKHIVGQARKKMAELTEEWDRTSPDKMGKRSFMLKDGTQITFKTDGMTNKIIISKAGGEVYVEDNELLAPEPLPVLDLYDENDTSYTISGAIVNRTKLNNPKGVYNRATYESDGTLKDIRFHEGDWNPTPIQNRKLTGRGALKKLWGAEIEELEEWGVEHTETYGDNMLAAVETTSWEDGISDTTYWTNPLLITGYDISHPEWTALAEGLTDPVMPPERNSGWEKNETTTTKIYLKGVVVKQATITLLSSLERHSTYSISDTTCTAVRTNDYSGNSIGSDLFRLTPDGDDQHYAYFWASTDATDTVTDSGVYTELATNNGVIGGVSWTWADPYVPQPNDDGMFWGNSETTQAIPNPQVDWYVNFDGTDYKVWTGRVGIERLYTTDLEIYKFPRKASNPKPVLVFAYKIYEYASSTWSQVWYGMIYKEKLYQLMTETLPASSSYDWFSDLESNKGYGHATIRAAQVRRNIYEIKREK